MIISTIHEHEFFSFLSPSPPSCVLRRNVSHKTFAKINIRRGKRETAN